VLYDPRRTTNPEGFILIARKHFVALAVATLLAGCGGGSDSDAVTPQTVISSLRAAAGALRAASPEAAANQLMDLGESEYSQFFPSHQPTGSSPPFLYRFYPDANQPLGGTYLGVVVTAGTQFTLNGVYVMGGAFGTEPQFVGLLSDFGITTNDPPSGGGGGGNGCYDLALFDTQGTHLEITYQYSGSVTGTQNVDTLVGGIATFQGQSARETTLVTSGTNFAGGFQVDGTFTGKNYANRTGAAEVTQYGTILSGSGVSSGITATLSSTSVFSPAFVDQQYSLGVGQTFNATQTIVTTGSVSALGFSQPLNSNTTQSYAVTYVGQEAVTVPAGTYNTCKLQTTTTAAGATTTQTSWVIVGKGIPVKTTTTAAGVTQTIQASSVKLNGSSL
jgi:hypothetical protein